MQPSSELVEDGLVVTLHFTLTGEDGDVIDSSLDRDPLAILQGAHNIVDGLERALAGRRAGDSFEVTVPPSEGYGERMGEGPETIPLAAFPEGAELFPGMQFTVTDETDTEINFYVVGMEGDDVVVERDHPLAGVALHFEVTVVAVRAATDEERAHGHPHGPEGHTH